MRFSLVFCGLCVASQAMAIGVCEEVGGTSRVAGIGPDRVAVEREVEICEETDEGEARHMRYYVEILDQAGNAVERYAGKDTPIEELEGEGVTVKPGDALPAALAAAGIAPRAPDTHPKCTVTAQLKERTLTLVVKAAGRKAPLHEEELTDLAAPDLQVGKIMQVWWQPNGGAVVEVRAPIIIEQGALGSYADTFVSVLVVGPDVVPAMSVCAGPAAPAAPASAAPPSAAVPASAAPASAAPASAAPASAAPASAAPVSAP